MIQELAKLFKRRSMSRDHRAQLLCHLRHFAASADDDWSAFNDDDVNDWLDELEEEGGRATKTLRAYRSSVLNGWRTAYRAGHVERPVGDIRTIRKERRPPVAWTAEEISRLLTAAKLDQDGQWVAAYIHLIWSTALRQADALRVNLRDVRDDGVWYLTQNKTGDAHTVRLNKNAIASLRLIGGQLPHRTRGQVAAAFRRLRVAAAVRPGTARWLRRSAASYVERDRPGYGEKLLGHRTPGLGRRNYFDPAIVGSVVDGPEVSLPC